MNTKAIEAVLAARGKLYPITKLHHVKTHRHYFDAMVWGTKTAELREDDRGYVQGDLLAQYELDDDKQWTGRVIVHRITHIVTETDGPWLANGHVMLSLGVPELIQDYVGERYDHGS